MKQNMPSFLLLGASLAATSLDSLAQEKPNIVLINIDDLGWTDLSFQQDQYYETPNIDALRKRSLFFDNAYAGAANSAPSRACMMSGQYSPRHEMYTVNPADRGKAKHRKLISAANRTSLPESSITLAQALKSVGYHTCHVGKWHLGEDPTTQGMDVNIAGNMKGHPKSYFSPYKNPDIKDGPTGEYLTDRLATEAIDYLKEQKKGPFFLYFAPYSVHTPLQPKPELLAKYEAKSKGKQHDNAKYAAMIETMDSNVGRIISYLEDSKLIENTIVILTSDNGGVYNISKQWPLRAGKGSFYEGGIRVPFIVRWDGVTTANTTSHDLVAQIDIYPTLMEIIDHKPSNYKLDGISFLTSLKGKKAKQRSLHWHFPAYLDGGNAETKDRIYRSRPVSVIRNGEWKLIHNYETNTQELYNLKNDIAEKNELSSKYPQKKKELYKELTQWLKKVDAPTEFKKNPLYQE